MGICIGGYGISSTMWSPIQLAIANPNNVEAVTPPGSEEAYFEDDDVLKRVPILLYTMSAFYGVFLTAGNSEDSVAFWYNIMNKWSELQPTFWRQSQQRMRQQRRNQSSFGSLTTRRPLLAWRRMSSIGDSSTWSWASDLDTSLPPTRCLHITRPLAWLCIVSCFFKAIKIYP